MRPAVVLVATIAVAAVAGTAVSLAQRPPATAHTSRSTPSGVAATPPNNQPAVAFGFSVASDAATQHLVLFGGVDNSDETWLWDGAAWARAHAPISPSGRYGASAAFDPEIREVLLFGGTLQTGQATNDTAPEAEVIDPADSQFLILGSAIAGADALTQTVQVWAMRGAHWLMLGVGLASG